MESDLFFPITVAPHAWTLCLGGWTGWGTPEFGAGIDTTKRMLWKDGYCSVEAGFEVVWEELKREPGLGKQLKCGPFEKEWF